MLHSVGHRGDDRASDLGTVGRRPRRLRIKKASLATGLDTLHQAFRACGGPESFAGWNQWAFTAAESTLQVFLVNRWSASGFGSFCFGGSPFLLFAPFDAFE